MSKTISDVDTGHSYPSNVQGERTIMSETSVPSSLSVASLLEVEVLLPFGAKLVGSEIFRLVSRPKPPVA